MQVWAIAFGCVIGWGSFINPGKKFLPNSGVAGTAIAMVLGALGRCLSATLAGVFYWETAPWASLVYNGAYMVPNTLLALVLAGLLYAPLKNYFAGNDLKK